MYYNLLIFIHEYNFYALFVDLQLVKELDDYGRALYNVIRSA